LSLQSRGVATRLLLLADGLAEYSAAYGKLARGLQTSNEGFGNTAFDQMEALLESAEQKVSSALGRLRL
jgi:hypothetical protein